MRASDDHSSVAAKQLQERFTFTGDERLFAEADLGSTGAAGAFALASKRCNHTAEYRIARGALKKVVSQPG